MDICPCVHLDCFDISGYNIKNGITYDAFQDFWNPLMDDGF